MKVLVLFSSSIGEIDWILPALVVLKRDYGADIVAGFHSPQLYAKLGQNPFLAQTLRETAQICFEPLRHALAGHRPESFDVLLKDDTGDSFTPQRAHYVQACTRAKNVVFPCSGVIYGLAGDTPASIRAVEKRVAQVMGFAPPDWGRSDLCLCSSPNDIPVLSLRYAPESIRAVGFPRYDEWWLHQLIEKSQGLLHREHTFLEGRAGVLFVIRGPHPLYLTEQDYAYLMRTFCAAMMTHPDWRSLIKPHPRQSEDELTHFLKAYPKDRFMISQQPIMLLSPPCHGPWFPCFHPESWTPCVWASPRRSSTSIRATAESAWNTGPALTEVSSPFIAGSDSWKPPRGAVNSKGFSWTRPQERLTLRR
jgi:hypothetical protein